MQKIRTMLDEQISACVLLQCTVELVYVFAAGADNIRYDTSGNTDALIGLHHSLQLQAKALQSALQDAFDLCCRMEKDP